MGMKLRMLDPSPILADVLIATRLEGRFPVEVTFCRLPTENVTESGARHRRKQQGAAMTVKDIKRKFKLGELLVNGLARLHLQENVDAALKRSRDAGTMLGETLVEMGLLKAVELLKIVGNQVGLPSVELRPGLIDPETLTYIPKEKAQYYGVIPMFHVDGRLTMATSRPLSIFDFDDLERLSECPIQLVLCDAAAVKQSIEKYYGNDMNIDGLLSSIEKNKVEIVVDGVRKRPSRSGRSRKIRRSPAW